MLSNVVQSIPHQELLRISDQNVNPISCGHLSYQEKIGCRTTILIQKKSLYAFIEMQKLTKEDHIFGIKITVGSTEPTKLMLREIGIPEETPDNDIFTALSNKKTLPSIPNLLKNSFVVVVPVANLRMKKESDGGILVPFSREGKTELYFMEERTKNDQLKKNSPPNHRRRREGHCAHWSKNESGGVSVINARNFNQKSPNSTNLF